MITGKEDMLLSLVEAFLMEQEVKHINELKELKVRLADVYN